MKIIAEVLKVNSVLEVKYDAIVHSGFEASSFPPNYGMT